VWIASSRHRLKLVQRMLAETHVELGRSLAGPRPLVYKPLHGGAVDGTRCGLCSRRGATWPQATLYDSNSAGGHCSTHSNAHPDTLHQTTIATRALSWKWS
jgi:hypothetical protein